MRHFHGDAGRHATAAGSTALPSVGMLSQGVLQTHGWMRRAESTNGLGGPQCTNLVIPVVENADMSVLSSSKGVLVIISEPRARIEIRLVGGLHGAVPLRVLNALVHLQEAVHRLGKSLAGRAGREGRSPQSIEDLTRLNLVAITSGSSPLVLEAPADTDLPISELDVGLEALDLFEGGLAGLAQGDPLPAEVDDLSRQSLRLFVDGLAGYGSVEIADERPYRDRRFVQFQPQEVSAALQAGDSTIARDEVVVVGVLYAVDIKGHSYRLEDELGNSIHFSLADDIDQLETIRTLIGRRVEVSGVAVVDTRGGIRQFAAHAISPAAELAMDGAFDFESALGAARPLESLETWQIPDLTVEESEAFWRVLKG